MLKYINNNNNNNTTYLGLVLLEKCVTKTFFKVELGKLKFDLFYLSKVVLENVRITALFNQVNLEQKPYCPTRGEKDLTHGHQKQKVRDRVVKNWNRLPREVVAIPFLDFLKKVWIWRTWFSGEHVGGATLTAGLDDLTVLLQP